MTQSEKMELVKAVCRTASRGTDCRGLSLSAQVRQLMDAYGIPTTAEIHEIPVCWDSQISVLFSVGDGMIYEIACGNAIDGSGFFEELSVSNVEDDGYIAFEDARQLPINHFEPKHKRAKVNNRLDLASRKFRMGKINAEKQPSVLSATMCDYIEYADEIEWDCETINGIASAYTDWEGELVGIEYYDD